MLHRHVNLLCLCSENAFHLQTLKSRKMPRSTRKGTVSLMKEHEAEGPMNQELKALEAHMLSMSKQGRLVMK